MAENTKTLNRHETFLHRNSVFDKTYLPSHHSHHTTAITPQSSHHSRHTTAITPQSSHHSHHTTAITPQPSHHSHDTYVYSHSTIVGLFLTYPLLATYRMYYAQWQYLKQTRNLPGILTPSPTVGKLSTGADTEYIYICVAQR